MASLTLNCDIDTYNAELRERLIGLCTMHKCSNVDDLLQYMHARVCNGCVHMMPENMVARYI